MDFKDWEMNTVWEQFEIYEQGMCERGSGMTQEQLTGAAIFYSWLMKSDRPITAKITLSLARKYFDDLNAMRDAGTMKPMELRNVIDATLQAIDCASGSPPMLINSEIRETHQPRKVRQG